MALDKLVDSTTLNSGLTSIANAIRAKGKTNASMAFPAGFVSAIGAIETGGGENGHGVVFYDYDGTVVETYTADEFASLSAMPANPTHTGLVAQGWNWSLSDAKTYVAKYGELNIGQMYVTQSGATEIDVEMHEGRLDPLLNIKVNGIITIDWGDNTTPDTVTGSSLIDSSLAVPHTYANKGNYTISIFATGDNKYRLSGSTSYQLLRKNTTQNENYVYSNTIKHIKIGNNAEIGDYAFVYCGSLLSITIPDSITSIGSYAFNYCYSLSSVVIPDGVTSITSNTFNSCYSLSNITIPDSVTSIGSYAFYYCTSLSSITIPDGVTSIGSYTFQNCYSLTSITIPDGVTSISGAFYNCNSLRSIAIPDGLTSIGSQVFYYCYSLPSITIPDGVTSIGSNAFRSCCSLFGINIPDGVTSISAQAFQNCYSLSIITIPDSVTSIGKQAFQNCYGVKEYHILPTTVPTGGTTMFDGISSDCIIYVPKGHLNDYQTATNWSTYASYMQEEPT